MRINLCLWAYFRTSRDCNLADTRGYKLDTRYNNWFYNRMRTPTNEPLWGMRKRLMFYNKIIKRHCFRCQKRKQKITINTNWLLKGKKRMIMFDIPRKGKRVKAFWIEQNKRKGLREGLFNFHFFRRFA